MKTLRATAALLVSIFFSANAPAAEPPSVAGVRLGMTIEEAQAAVGAHGASLGQRIKQSDKKFEASAYGRQATPFISTLYLTFRNVQQPPTGMISDDLTVVLSAPPNQRVIAVGRNTFLASPVAVDAVVKQLSDKHGPVTDQHNAFWWFFDTRSTRIAPPAASNTKGKYCNDAAKFTQFENRLGSLLQQRSETAQLQYLDGPDPACGIVLQLDKAPADSDTTKFIRVLLIDQKRYYEALVEGDRNIRMVDKFNRAKQLEESKKNDVPKI